MGSMSQGSMSQGSMNTGDRYRDHGQGQGGNAMGGQGQSHAQGHNFWGSFPGSSSERGRYHQPTQWNRQDYQRNVTASRHFHWSNGSYHRPHGWYYRRWVYGEVFPSLFWDRDYWITDYWNYGLDDPPYGYVWVRYGDDAVLINEDTGEILQVEYGIFY